jgi:hypothetical protein
MDFLRKRSTSKSVKEKRRKRLELQRHWLLHTSGSLRNHNRVKRQKFNLRPDQIKRINAYTDNPSKFIRDLVDNHFLHLPEELKDAN